MMQQICFTYKASISQSTQATLYLKQPPCTQPTRIHVRNHHHHPKPYQHTVLLCFLQFLIHNFYMSIVLRLTMPWALIFISRSYSEIEFTQWRGKNLYLFYRFICVDFFLFIFLVYFYLLLFLLLSSSLSLSRSAFFRYEF